MKSDEQEQDVKKVTMLNKRQKRKGEDEKNKKMNILEKKHNWVDYQILPCHRAAEPFHQ